MTIALGNNTSTTTVVNAAFLQEVKDSNVELWSVLRDLRELSKSCTEESAECIELSHKLVDQLSLLRDCIGLEFSLEETYGFIEGAQSFQIPTANADRAKSQHRELYLQLHEICEKAEEAQYRGTISRDLPIYFGAFEQFDSSFTEHEAMETELIRAGLGFGKDRSIISL